MTTKEKTTIQFNRTTGPYFCGDVATFDSGVADRYLKARVAVKCDPPKALKPAKEEPLVTVRAKRSFGRYNDGEVFSVYASKVEQMIDDGLVSIVSLDVRGKAVKSPDLNKAISVPLVSKGNA